MDRVGEYALVSVRRPESGVLPPSLPLSGLRTLTSAYSPTRSILSACYLQVHNRPQGYKLRKSDLAPPPSAKDKKVPLPHRVL